MQCLSCGVPLHTTAREGIEVEQCAACQGVWLDVGELRALLETHEVPTDAVARAAAVAARRTPPAESDASAPARPCPACHVPMERVNYDEASGILVDSCLEHGVWLDGGELARLEVWAEGWDEQFALPAPPSELADRRAALDDAWGAQDEGWGPLGLLAASWRWHRGKRAS